MSAESGEQLRICPARLREERLRITAMNAGDVGSAVSMTSVASEEYLACQADCPGPTTRPVKLLGITLPFDKGICAMEVQQAVEPTITDQAN